MICLFLSGTLPPEQDNILEKGVPIPSEQLRLELPPIRILCLDGVAGMRGAVLIEIVHQIELKLGKKVQRNLLLYLF